MLDGGSIVWRCKILLANPPICNDGIVNSFSCLFLILPKILLMLLLLLLSCERFFFGHFGGINIKVIRD